MELCKHRFRLIDADEYALRYMENNADQAREQQGFGHL